MPDCNLPFDIRDYAPYGPSNDYVEAGYDLINRLVLLMYGLCFDDLYTSPWGGVMTGMLNNFENYRGCGVFKHEAYVRAGLKRLALYSDVTWYQYLNGAACPDCTKDITDVCVELWKLGVCFPYIPPSEVPEVAKSKKERSDRAKQRFSKSTDAINGLITDSNLKQMTWRDVFPGGRITRAMLRRDPEANNYDPTNDPINNALAAGLFPNISNGACCDADEKNETCINVGNSGMFCLPLGQPCVVGGGITDCGPFGVE